MEAGRYLPAARLYLLCRHLHGLLQLDAPRARYSPILARFPILLRQVAAASHFRWVPPPRLSGVQEVLPGCQHPWRKAWKVFRLLSAKQEFLSWLWSSRRALL